MSSTLHHVYYSFFPIFKSLGYNSKIILKEFIVNHVKSFFYFAASAVLLALLSGCASNPPAVAIAAPIKQECMQEGVVAPSWTCKPQLTDVYASLGVAQQNGADKAQTIKNALYNGRVEIAKQIQAQVREKLNNFARTPEGSNKEKIDDLYASIALEVKPKDLYLQERLQSWTTPSGKVFIHVITSKPSFDTSLKKAVKLSYINNKAAWLGFNSSQAIANLEKEFDVVVPIEEKSVKVANLFQVESVTDMIVGRNRRH
jgi:hypothetical protein